MRLHFFIKRNGNPRNSQNRNCKNGNTDGKNKCRLWIDGKCHNHGAKYDKRTPEQKTQHHIDTVLQTGYISGNSGNQCLSTYFIQFFKGKFLNVRKQLFAKGSCKADTCACRKKLCCNGKCQPRGCKQNQKYKVKYDMFFCFYPYVYNICNNQRYYQVKKRLNKFKCRCQNTIFRIRFQVLQQTFQVKWLSLLRFSETFRNSHQHNSDNNRNDTCILGCFQFFLQENS